MKSRRMLPLVWSALAILTAVLWPVLLAVGFIPLGIFLPPVLTAVALMCMAAVAWRVSRTQRRGLGLPPGGISPD